MFCLQIQYVFKIHVCIYISINCLCHSQYNELSVCIFPAPVLCTIIFCVFSSLIVSPLRVSKILFLILLLHYFIHCVYMLSTALCWYQWVAWIVWTCQLFKLISWKADQYIYNSGVNCVKSGITLVCLVKAILCIKRSGCLWPFLYYINLL